MNDRLALGTVLFGMDYGLDGSRRMHASEVHRILELGHMHGLDTLDTAAAYGDSEEVLGKARIDRWRVVTKLPAVPSGCPNAEAWIVTAASSSLERLRIPTLHGLLLHRAADLLDTSSDAVYAGLRSCQERGLTRKVGVSLYEPGELTAILPRYPLSLVQAPFNVLDRRLRESGWLDRLKRSGVEVHARSVFLQGLLLMPEAPRLEKFRKWNPVLRRWHHWLHENEVSALKACLRFVFEDSSIDRVVVGINSRAQLQEILGILDDPGPTPPPSLVSDDLDLINPSGWNRP